ncbi:hypothetical protein KDA_23070 [Dictyobacter alpinus]|uniref:Protein kinase domain-containing protein n=1 Tax=Dictyobacter alpinus TaxID=2014873 RepID=A0A402B638_9CHLR|nr:serine/threonine-protein kinase [Dictyobacter alpinus]GCE26823.1 hypothetical protein KDA_23070 [Dictyobacter alpinus]
MTIPSKISAKKDCGFQFGNYSLFRILRRGAVATIYLGEHSHLGYKVVVKVLNNWMASQEQTRRFCAEARLHASIHHKNIVRILDFGVKGNIPFMVMDYAAHGTLQDYFKPGVALSLADILPFVENIANALQHIHNHNIIHRDIKPQNILLNLNNEVWLSDFGIALALQPWNSHTIPQDSVGTALYAAPEQIEGRPLKMSDQYSLAVLVYTWLCGQTPFMGSSVQLCKQHLYQEPLPLRDIVPSIPEYIEKAVLKALAKDPYQRFANVQDFAQTLMRMDEGYYTDPALPMLGAANAVQPEIIPYS